MLIGTGLASVPVAKADAESNLAAKVATYIREAVAQASDGITLVEAGHLLFALMTLAMQAADEWRSQPGDMRKAWVLDAVGRLYDALLPFMPLPVRVPIVSGVIRQVVLALASGAIEAWLPTVRAAR